MVTRIMKLALALLVSSCAWTFDEGAPEIRLIGEPPDMSALPRLNRGRAMDARIVRGFDADYWVAIREPVEVLRVRSLADPAREEVLTADSVLVRWRAFYLLRDRGEAGMELNIRAAGEPGPGTTFQMPKGEPLIITAGRDDIFLYFARSKDTRSFEVVYKDGSHRRSFPVPEGVDPEQPLSKGMFFFEGTGKWLYVRDGNGRLFRHSTLDNRTIDLGTRPRKLVLWESRQAVFTCGEDGLRAVPVTGAMDRVIDAEPCGSSSLYFFGDEVFYFKGEKLYRTRLDGSTRPELLHGGVVRQILAFGPDDQLVYSRDPPDRYVHGAGDGWLGEWQFMQRGRSVSFGNDGKRLRWIERAATLVGSGDLMSARLYEEPVLLARNVSDYSDLGSGEVLAVANYPYWGTHNRIILIDEERRIARWVAQSASSYMFIPRSNDLLVFVTTGESGFDIVRMPLPPRLD